MICDVLLHAEDPGAANVLAPLVEPLSERGFATVLCAGGAAVDYFGARGIGFVPQSKTAGATLDQHRPRLLVEGTSEEADAMGLTLIDEARARGIGTIGAVDMLANAERRFRGHSRDPLCHAPDWIAVPDSVAAGVYRKLGHPGARLAVCGHPHFDIVRARREVLAGEDRAALRAQVFPGPDPERPVIVFLAEGIDRLNPSASSVAPDAALRGSGTSDDRTTVVLEELLDAVETLTSRPRVVLRLHPKNGAGDYGGLRGRIDLVSRGGDPLALVWCADRVVGMTTFLLVEAALLGRPTLSILPNPADAALLPTTASGHTPVVSTPAGLREQLALAPMTADVEGLLPTGSAGRYVDLITSCLDIGEAAQ